MSEWYLLTVYFIHVQSPPRVCLTRQLEDYKLRLIIPNITKQNPPKCPKPFGELMITLQLYYLLSVLNSIHFKQNVF